MTSNESPRGGVHTPGACAASLCWSTCAVSLEERGQDRSRVWSVGDLLRHVEEFLVNVFCTCRATFGRDGQFVSGVGWRVEMGSLFFLGGGEVNPGFRCPTLIPSTHTHFASHPARPTLGVQAGFCEPNSVREAPAGLTDDGLSVT